jgi:hypothetical protein
VSIDELWPLIAAAGQEHNFVLRPTAMPDHQPSDCTVLEPAADDSGRWVVYYSERGQIWDPLYFDTEDGACAFAYARATAPEVPARKMTPEEPSRVAAKRSSTLATTRRHCGNSEHPSRVFGRRLSGVGEVEVEDVVGGVVSGSLVGVEPGRGCPFGHPCDYSDGPALFLELAVMERAQQTEVGEVGGSAEVPGDDVVGFAPGRWSGAAGKRAAAVAGGQCEALPAGG